jgi:hypothetical protein
MAKNERDTMSSIENNDPPRGIAQKFMAWARTRDGWTMIAAFAFSVITSIPMAGLLAVEDEMSAFGVLFIYFVTMIIVAGIIRMGAGYYDKYKKRRA